MTIENIPFGVGDFAGSLPPGEGTGEIDTTSAFDIMLPPYISSDPHLGTRLGLRLRLKGFNHGMPIQDQTDVMGGFQTNDSQGGGLRWYSFSTTSESWRTVAIAAIGDTSTVFGSALSLSPMTLQSWKKNNDPIEQAGRFADNENILAIANSRDNVILVKGDGSIHTAKGKVSTLTEGETSPSISGISLVPGAKKLRWTSNGSRTTVTGFLMVESISYYPSTLLLVNALPTTATEYVPVTIWATNFSPSLTSVPMGYTIPGTKNIVLMKMVAGQHSVMAQDVLAGSQFMISVTY